jgi:hypothetical protein
MMVRPTRNGQFVANEICIVHTVQRCVSKAFLAGVDQVSGVPAKLQAALSSLGIEASMWRDLVWNFTRYFGRASCAGSPESMAADAARTGKHLQDATEN